MANNGDNLIEAAKQGDIDRVREMVEVHNIDPNTVTQDWTPLVGAVYMNNTEIVQFLVENGASVNLASGDNWTPLYAAANRGYPELALYLINNGADVSIPSYNNKTPITVATENGKAITFRTILENSPPLTIEKLKELLKIAQKQEHRDITALLRTFHPWEEIETQNIQHYAIKGDFQITRIFNFQAMSVLTVLESNTQHGQSHDEKSFSDPSIDMDLLLKAKKELLERGGQVNEQEFMKALRAPKSRITHQMTRIKRKI